MSLSKREFEKQQESERRAAAHAAEKQAEIVADLDRLHAAGTADITDIERLQQMQAELAEDLEILRKKEEEGERW